MKYYHHFFYCVTRRAFRIPNSENIEWLALSSENPRWLMRFHGFDTDNWLAKDSSPIQRSISAYILFKFMTQGRGGSTMTSPCGDRCLKCVYRTNFLPLFGEARRQNLWRQSSRIWTSLWRHDSSRSRCWWSERNMLLLNSWTCHRSAEPLAILHMNTRWPAWCRQRFRGFHQLPRTDRHRFSPDFARSLQPLSLNNNKARVHS